MKYIKGIFALMIAVVFSGCAGIAVGTYGKHEKLRTSYSLLEGRNNFGYRTDPGGYSEEDILRLWGEPDSIEFSGTCKVLSYRNGRAWSGVGAFVFLVPVPLLVPSGYYENRFYINEDDSVALVTEYGEVKYAFGSMMGSNEARFLAGRVNEEQTKADLGFCD